MPSTQNPLADARTQLAEAIQFLGFDEGMRRMLETARKEVTVSIPLRRDDGTMDLYICLLYTSDAADDVAGV